MKNKFLHISSKPFFLALLPLFYFQHALLENYAPALIPDAVKLFLIHLGVALTLTLICIIFYKKLNKAALASFSLLIVYFFFSSVQKLLTTFPGGHFISRYAFLLPFFILAIFFVFWYLKKTDRRLLEFSRYLNLLLLLLIVIDFFGLLKSQKAFTQRIEQTNQPSLPLRNCDTCSKPDIYLIVLDEYAGAQQLKEQFHFDNSYFYSSLSQRGFHLIKNSKSNYNTTVYSMASMFNMSYLKNVDNGQVEKYSGVLYCRELIQHNPMVNFLKLAQGYQIYNLSFFDIHKKKRLTQNILTSNSDILSGATLFNKLRFTFGAKLASKEKLYNLKLRQFYDNQKIGKYLHKSISLISKSPKFIYAHLNLPHWYYYFDSAGNRINLTKLNEEQRTDKKAYIQYLQYTNQYVLKLIDEIKAESSNPPVIFLISDHGFRQFAEKADKKYYFMNLNAVLLPSQNYNSFYEGMSNVNIFRTFLNTQFHQNLPLLADSSVFINN